MGAAQLITATTTGSSSSQNLTASEKSGGFRLADTWSDSELMNHAFAYARELLEDDPHLTAHPALKRMVEKMYAETGNILN